MRKFILTVAMAVAALVGFSAAANAYSLAPGGSGTATSDAALTFSGPLGITTSCDLELDTTLATSGNKAARARFVMCSREVAMHGPSCSLSFGPRAQSNANSISRPVRT